MNSGSFKSGFTNHIFNAKHDLALNNLQWLMCHKTQPNLILYIQYICIKKIWH